MGKGAVGCVGLWVVVDVGVTLLQGILLVPSAFFEGGSVPPLQNVKVLTR